MNEKYIDMHQAQLLTGLTLYYLKKLCREGRLDGAVKMKPDGYKSEQWFVPRESLKEHEAVYETAWKWINPNERPLAQIRVKAGYTRKEAALQFREDMEMTAYKLLRYELNELYMTIALAEEMARVYGVKHSDIRTAASKPVV